MTIIEARNYAREQLKIIYDETESAGIAGLVLEYITGIRNLTGSAFPQIILTDGQQENLNRIINRLLKHEPVQYVLNEAWFGGLKFFVDARVLIPRPETEELVEWIIVNCRFPVSELKILDIGTGSGCISVALKRRIRKAEVWSCDSSEAALGVGKRNSETLGAEVNFLLLDFLDPEARKHLPSFDIIVSNPPYVPEKDKETMHSNVLQYEPATALFVPDSNPLIFYTAIAEFGREHLNPGGSIYCEIHEDLGTAVSSLFNNYGYATELKKDLQEKERMVRAVVNR